MNLVRNISISGKILLEHKVRTTLSLIGIIAGVCTVILLTAIGKGTEKKAASAIMKMGSNQISINAGQVKIIAGRERQTNIVETLELQDAEYIAENVSGAQFSAPAHSKNLQIKYGNLNTKTSVIGTTFDMVYVQDISISEGRFFDDSENNGLMRVAVIGKTVVKNVFGQENPLGKIIYIKKIPFEVIGIMAPKGLDSYGSDLDDRVFIPIKTALRRLFNLSYINAIYIKVKNVNLMADTENDARQVLRKRHHLREGKDDDFTIQNQSLVLETLKENSRTFTLLTSTIAALSLLVGGIGILVVMLISTRERTKEIGLRRAVGAKRPDILIQFLSEAAILSAGGGLIGFVLGMTSATFAAVVMHLPLILPYNVAILAFSSSFLIGVFFGVYPAVKAAGIDPIKALQSE